MGGQKIKGETGTLFSIAYWKSATLSVRAILANVPSIITFLSKVARLHVYVS